MDKRKYIKIEPIIKNNLDILFVGINPVMRSFKQGQYKFFSSNSHFYTLLKQAGLTKEKIDSTKLLENNLGITNLYDDYFGIYTLIKFKKIIEYVMKLEDLFRKYKPQKIAFLGKHVARQFFPGCSFGNIGTIKDSQCYCIPFPIYPMKKEKKLKYYGMLK